ncbi:FecR family protein [Rhizobium cremeum]|uniref:FecR family protein n=1 Tax=Rhizobium cremeum TaxID=2813827 RepID=UPI0039E091E1
MKQEHRLDCSLWPQEELKEPAKETTLGSKAKTERELLGEATRWILRLRGLPEDSPLRIEFDAWVSTSPDHRSAWASVNQAWNVLGAAQPAYADRNWAAAAPDAARSPSRRSHGIARRRLRRPFVLAASVLAAICLLWVFVPVMLIDWRSDYRTAAGQTELVRLADGSTVELSGSSAISTQIVSAERRVRLLAGAAFFDVAHDEGRPFRVDADGIEVTVLGTAFDVEVSSASTTVALLRGSISAEMTESDDAPVVLHSGQVAVIDHTDGKVTVKDIALEDIGAWRDGKILLEGVTVREAIETVQRYHTAWIVMPDSELAERRISGLFDLANPDKALAAIVGPFGGRVRAITPFSRVISGF